MKQNPYFDAKTSSITRQWYYDRWVLQQQQRIVRLMMYSVRRCRVLQGTPFRDRSDYNRLRYLKTKFEHIEHKRDTFSSILSQLQCDLMTLQLSKYLIIPHDTFEEHDYEHKEKLVVDRLFKVKLDETNSEEQCSPDTDNEDEKEEQVSETLKLEEMSTTQLQRLHTQCCAMRILLQQIVFKLTWQVEALEDIVGSTNFKSCI